MILPEDRDTIRAMVGDGFNPNHPPKEFDDEYTVRLLMSSRAGCTGGLGVAGLLPLLRQFGIAPTTDTDDYPTDRWDLVSQGTPIRYMGQRGVFAGRETPGLISVKLDGQRAVLEARESDVMLISKPAGHDEKDFEEEPAPAAAVLTEAEAETEPETIDLTSDEVLAVMRDQWSSVKPGSSVIAMDGGIEVEGRYVGMEQNRAELRVLVKGEKRVFPAQRVALG